MIEETRIIRVDTQVYDKKALDSPASEGKLNTLKDLKVVHNSAFMAEVKDPDEVAAQDEVSTVEGKKYVQDVIDLDDTDKWRTVIANSDLDKTDTKRYKVDLDWTLTELRKFLVRELDLAGDEYRLRNLLNDKLFVVEEMEKQLRAFESFKEGGTRIQVEFGRPTSLAEISVSIAIHN